MEAIAPIYIYVIYLWLFPNNCHTKQQVFWGTNTLFRWRDNINSSKL